jgi:hypothetical protein
MMAVVVDTNVAEVANDAVKTPANNNLRSLECIDACVEALLTITREGHLVLDSLGLIFEEYGRRLSFAGQPGTGDLFMKWVNDHQWDTTLCTRVDITLHDGRGFDEFPVDNDLSTFDWDDRKFVAVAAAHGGSPRILQAVDYKWAKWSDALKAAGITVRFLCALPNTG